jgi:hypothetical protein
VWGFRVLLVVSVLAGLVVAPSARAVGFGGPRLLFDGVATYPRVVRLQHSGAADGRVLVSVNGELDGDGVGIIFESVDSGASFRRVGLIREPEGTAGRGQCCGSLFELPRSLGELPAGTLLWANTTGWEVDAQERRVRQRLWASRDQGRSWRFVADMAVSPSGYNAWEPELSMAADGALVLHWSDESGKPHQDQKLVQARSWDGVHWGDQRDTVAGDDFYLRPGMASVRRLPDGSFLMAYEVCNLPEPLCAIYVRTSRDGWDYGDPAYLGEGVRTADGKYPRHTPTIDVTSSGVVLLVSEMLVNADGSHAPRNGGAILVRAPGEGWVEVDAPISTPGVDNEGCRNFSPALLASPDGRRVLEVSTDYDRGVCKAYYASGPLP